MNWHEIECPKCAVRLQTRVLSMGVPGGKEKEEGHCPICGACVISEMTDGFVDVQLVATGGFKITTPDGAKAIKSTPGGIDLTLCTFNGRAAAEKFADLYWPNPVWMVESTGKN